MKTLKKTDLLYLLKGLGWSWDHPRPFWIDFEKIGKVEKYYTIKTYQDVSRRTKTYQDVSRHTKTYQDVTYQDVPRRTKLGL